MGLAVMSERQRDAQARHPRSCNCDECTGAAFDDSMQKCDECGGDGQLDEVHAGAVCRVGCDKCQGTGEITSDVEVERWDLRNKIRRLARSGRILLTPQEYALYVSGFRWTSTPPLEVDGIRVEVES